MLQVAQFYFDNKIEECEEKLMKSACRWNGLPSRAAAVNRYARRECPPQSQFQTQSTRRSNRACTVNQFSWFHNSILKFLKEN